MDTDTMNSPTDALLRSRLLDLARRHDALAAEEARATPYWKPQPDVVHAHRTAANALRAEADLLLVAVRTRSHPASMVNPKVLTS